jgi:ATP-dependent helicase HrpA
LASSSNWRRAGRICGSSLTSATIDPDKFSAFFGGAPVIEVSGRSYPVEVRYRPLISGDPDDPQEDAAELSLPEGIVQAVRELDRDNNGLRGDTLVFLPGEKQIREASEALGKAELRHTEILPLFARLSARDQERIFAPHSARRIVLATNVAETSLTVPGIRFVIDSGLARISRYSTRGKVQRLPIERISQASADQRKGRCGREAAGICIRLWSEEEFERQEEFTPPEVLRTNLASVILRMATLGLGAPESFPFLDPPDTRLVNDGVRLLQELKAMDDQRQVTSLGVKIAGLPVDPRLGRMLLAASHHNCVTEMLVITSFLEAQDPRERPSDAQQQSAQKHALFADNRSDFITVLNLWRAFKEQAEALSRSQLRKWCREHFLSYLRMREWQELHWQLLQGLRELGLRPNEAEAGYSDLHQAILTGFLGSIGHLDERREYDGPRGMRFVIAPGTPLAAKAPKWVVAGSLLETARLYARMVAAVDSSWIEAAGAHLLKRTYSEPHWVEGRCRSMVCRSSRDGGLITVQLRLRRLARFSSATRLLK